MFLELNSQNIFVNRNKDHEKHPTVITCYLSVPLPFAC